jgi:hypothetical protein
MKPKFTYKLDFYARTRTPCILVYHRDYPGELYGKLSISPSTTDPHRLLRDNEFVVKVYSENESWHREALKPEFFKPTGHSIQLPYTLCPIYTITPKFIADQFDQTYNSHTDIFDAPDLLWSLYEKYVEKK